MDIFVRFYWKDQTVEQNKTGTVTCFHQKIILLLTASPQDEKCWGHAETIGEHWEKCWKKKKMQRDKTHKFQDHIRIFLEVIAFYVLFDERCLLKTSQ